MNKFFRRMPLMAKLLIIAVIPLTFIAYLTVDLYSEKANNLSQVKNYMVRIQQSATISRLIDALQKERRYSFDFALTKSHQTEMISRRPETNRLLNQLKNEHDESLREFTSYTFLGKLDSIRNLIDSSRFNPNGIMHFYSSAIFRLNTLNKISSLTNEELKDADENMTAQRLLSDLTTYQGIISANIYNVLYTRKYMYETLLGTYPSWDVYKTYEKEFTVKAGKGTLDRFQKIQSNGAFHAVDTYLDQLFSTYKFDSSYTYESWSVMVDNSINELTGIQMDLLKKVESRVDSYYRQESAAKERTVIYLVLIIVLLIAFLGYILHIINQTLKELQEAALKLSKGETNIKIEPTSNDSIGSLAASIHKIDEKNKELAMASKKIGDGNFDVKVQPRSEQDVLGNSILKMQENLLNYTNDLKKSRDEFETLADLIPQIVWVTNEEGAISYFNKKYYELTGAKQELNGQVWISVLHPDDVSHTLSVWNNSLKSGIPFQAEYRLKQAQTGEYNWFLGRAVPVKDKNGSILKWFGTATDVHDNKMHEQQLEELIRQRTMELNRSNEDLQQFAHVASHDLKEPLRKIKVFSERLKEQYGELIPEMGKIYLDKLKTSSERMSNMIDSILKYSVINATGNKDETVELNSVINDITNDLELLILQKEARIIHNHLPSIKGSPTLLHQLFYNLVSNSLKFSKKGCPPIITISGNKVSAEEVIGLVDAKKSGHYLHITMEDNGIGFNQEFADQMFNAFTRLNGRDKYEGTGLGLALCKKIVQRHNGAIYANGKEGIGSSFNVVLPISHT